ncbi:MAG TPA: glycine dehydrogenase (aminomethyl-transferring), partial [Caldithrix sp.]|nr:glycine dehydrogenase (aminomethyl-transferring) [Caldithrix sp.]
MDKNRENPNQFKKRQIGPRETDLREMLKVVQTESLDSLIDETIPADIRLEQPLNIPEPFSEYEYLKEVKKLAAKNKLFKSYIGMGFYNTITPPVIQRMILENPGWYTQYTPYQAEISQGRLEALLVFQTMVMDLTGMEVANASLLDEGTGAAEAMAMLFRLRSRELKKSDAHRFFISDTVYTTTLDVIRGRAEPLGIEIVVGDHREFEFDDRVFGALVQYPAEDGAIIDYSDFIQKAHRNTSLVAVAADLLSLTLLKPPGEMDADAVVGLTQRFG